MTKTQAMLHARYHLRRHVNELKALATGLDDKTMPTRIDRPADAADLAAAVKTLRDVLQLITEDVARIENIHARYRVIPSAHWSDEDVFFVVDTDTNAKIATCAATEDANRIANGLNALRPVTPTRTTKRSRKS